LAFFISNKVSSSNLKLRERWLIYIRGHFLFLVEECCIVFHFKVFTFCLQYIYIVSFTCFSTSLITSFLFLLKNFHNIVCCFIIRWNIICFTNFSIFFLNNIYSFFHFFKIMFINSSSILNFFNTTFKCLYLIHILFHLLFYLKSKYTSYFSIIIFFIVSLF